MINASTKVTRSSAIAGLLTAVLFALQEVQMIEDLPTWALMLVGTAILAVGTFLTGYQTTENNPSPSMLTAAKRVLDKR